MSFKQLEVNFQRKLNEYKTVYQDYLVELKNQSKDYWSTQDNVTVSNSKSSARIPFLTDPGITKKECLHACSSDERCKYVLFSDSGNGECAANQCLKWTKDAKGLITPRDSSKPEFFTIFVGNSNTNPKVITLPATGITVYPTPINAQDPGWNNKFDVSVSGNQLTVRRTDQNSGWGQMLQLQGVKDSDGYEEYTINVGSSSTNPKVVTLPKSGLVVNPSPINVQNPDWNNTFKISLSGDQLTVTRTDQNSGWGQNLKLRGVLGNTKGIYMENKACAPGKGPSGTDYVYSGWEKPTWKDTNNVSFMGDPSNVNTSEWKNLGGAKDMLACKDMSITSSEGPFSSVVFVSNTNKCYGGVPGANQEMLKIDGVYSSVPPMGSTNLGGASMLQYVKKLKELNNDLQDDLYNMRKKLQELKKTDRVLKPVMRETEKNIHSDFKKLKEDRVKLDEMSRELETIDVKLGMITAASTREKMIYMGSALLVIILLTYSFKKIFLR